MREVQCTLHLLGYYGIQPYIILIHFLYPLTKESVSTNNRNGRNYGGNGETAIVDDDGNTIEIINEDDERRIRW